MITKALTNQALEALRLHRVTIDQVIAAMEEIRISRKAGRRSMGAAERLQVSARMTEYWRKKREKSA